jgi:F0F1-type ATP synthase assembly protein I
MRRVFPDQPSPPDPVNGDPASSRQQTRRQGLAYQAAFEAVMAIPIAIGGGYWLDRHFDISPICLIAGAVLGFTAFVLRLLRLGRQLHISDHEPKP